MNKALRIRMIKRISIAILLTVGAECSSEAMDAETIYKNAVARGRERRQNEHLANAAAATEQSVAVQHRVAAFNEWKKDPEIATRLNTDEPETVQAYIHLSMFLSMPEEAAKSPVAIAIARQLAQQVCPRYQFWPEYYETYSRTKRGKCYKAEEQMELVLGPTMTKITRLKMMIAMLKGQEISSVQLTPDWKKEIETSGVPKNTLSLLEWIPIAIPPKRQELQNLKQEFDQCFLPNAIGVTIAREQENIANRQRLVQQEQARADLQQQIQLANESIKSGQDALQTKEQDLARERSIKGRLLAENNRAYQKEKRIASSLALFESSKMTGWESSFVEMLKSELKNNGQQG